jgi:hypothetical protein
MGYSVCIVMWLGVWRYGSGSWVRSAAAGGLQPGRTRWRVFRCAKQHGPQVDQVDQCWGYPGLSSCCIVCSP